MAANQGNVIRSEVSQGAYVEETFSALTKDEYKQVFGKEPPPDAKTKKLDDGTGRQRLYYLIQPRLPGEEFRKVVSRRPLSEQ